MKFQLQIIVIVMIGLGASAALAEQDSQIDHPTGDEPGQSIRLHGIDAQSGRAHVAVFADDSCYIAGKAWSKETGSRLWLWRIDRAGNKLWTKEIGGHERRGSESAVIGILPKGNEAGQAKPSGGVRVITQGSAQLRIISIDPDGGIEPDQTSVECRDGQGLVALPGGDLVTFGSDFAVEKSQSWIMRLSDTGTLRWKRNFEASAAKWSDEIAAARLQPPPRGFHRGDYLYAACLLSDGSLVFTGKTCEHNKFGQGPTKLWLLKINDRGERLAESFIDDGMVFPGTQELIATAGDGVLATYSVDQLPPICGAPHNFPPDGFRPRLRCLDGKLDKQWEALLSPTLMPGAAAISGPSPYISLTARPRELVAGAYGSDGEELWTSRVALSDGSALPLATLRNGDEVLAICNFTSHRKEDAQRMDHVLVVKVRPLSK